MKTVRPAANEGTLSRANSCDKIPADGYDRVDKPFKRCCFVLLTGMGPFFMIDERAGVAVQSLAIRDPIFTNGYSQRA